MALEIERKFLVTKPPTGAADGEGVRIEQGYLAVSESVEVRLRKAGGATKLTVKGGHGEVREEVEFDLDPPVFDALWPLTQGRRLTKTRRRAALGEDLTAEVDFFEDELDGLVLAEVEFESEAAERDFDPPGWFGAELTGDRRYAGQSLAGDGAPGPDRVDSPYRLKGKESVSEGTRRIARGLVAKALERIEEGGDDPEAAVHGVRKDLKKLRAVLRLLREGLGEDFYRRQNGRFRDAGRLLSDIRDAQVKLATLDALEERYGDEMPRQPSSLWRGILEGERRQTEEGAGEGLRARIREAKEAIGEGGDELADWPLDGHGWGVIEPGLVRGYREARKAMGRARRSGASEDVHEWRKRTKDLWYDLRLLRGTWKPVVGELAEQAHELAELLGDHHDLSVLAEDLEARQPIKERGRLVRLIERRQDELLKKALRLGSRLLAEKPKAFRLRLRAYWRAWR